jgi:hypothetical protein
VRGEQVDARAQVGQLAMVSSCVAVVGEAAIFVLRAMTGKVKRRVDQASLVGVVGLKLGTTLQQGRLSADVRKVAARRRNDESDGIDQSWGGVSSQGCGLMRW